MTLTKYAAETMAYMLEGKAVRSFLEDGEPMWFVTSDLYKAIGIGQSRMSQIVAELAIEDKGIRCTNTLGGKQSLTVISRSGMYQVIAQLKDRELGRRVRKWLADLGVAYETGKVADSSFRVDSERRFALLEQAINTMAATMHNLATAIKAVAERPAVALARPVTYHTKWGNEILPPRSRDTAAVQYKQGWVTAKTYLASVAGAGSTKGAAGLCQRALAYLAEKKQLTLVRRFARGHSHETYLPKDVLRFVHVHDIRADKSGPVQDGLFDRAEEQVKRGDITPPAADQV